MWKMNWWINYNKDDHGTCFFSCICIYLWLSMYSTCLYMYIYMDMVQRRPTPPPPKGMGVQSCFLWLPPLWPVLVGCLGCWWWVVCMYACMYVWMDGCAKLYPSTILLSVNNCFGWVLLSQCMCKMQVPWAQIQLEQRKAIEADRLDNCSEQYLETLHGSGAVILATIQVSS